MLQIIETYINESNFDELFPLRELNLGRYNTVKEHDNLLRNNKILNLMEEEDHFEYEETNFAIYF